MARTKYYYNPETCQYERVRITTSDVVFNFLGLCTAALAFAVVIMVIFNNYFDTPREAQLKKDNKELKTHHATMLSSLNEIEAMREVLIQRDQNIYGELYNGEAMEGKLIDDGVLPQYPARLADNGFSDQKALNSFGRNISLITNNVRSDLPLLTESMDNAVTNINSFEYIPTIQPIDNPELNALVTGFGKRINPYHHGLVDHEGIDFSAPRGTPVFSTGSGKVVFIKESDVKTGYGNRVEIDHGNGFITRYAHFDDIFVKKGQEVKKGETIGTVGISGGTIAPCIHYEIIQNGEHLNPINFFIEGLTEAEYVKLLELALRENQSLD